MLEKSTWNEESKLARVEEQDRKLSQEKTKPREEE